MTNTAETNDSSISATFEWRLVKISRPPQGENSRAKPVRRWRYLARRDWRAPLALQIAYRGGRTGCWVEVKTRGTSGMFPGQMTLVELVGVINGMTQEEFDRSF